MWRKCLSSVLPATPEMLTRSCQGDRLRQVLVDEIDRPPDIARRDRSAARAQRLAEIARLREQQPVQDELLELAGDQGVLEQRAIAIEVQRSPAQHAGEAAAVALFELHGGIEDQGARRLMSEQQGELPVQRVAAYRQAQPGGSGLGPHHLLRPGRDQDAPPLVAVENSPRDFGFDPAAQRNVQVIVSGGGAAGAAEPIDSAKRARMRGQVQRDAGVPEIDIAEPEIRQEHAVDPRLRRGVGLRRPDRLESGAFRGIEGARRLGVPAAKKGRAFQQRLHDFRIAASVPAASAAPG